MLSRMALFVVTDDSEVEQQSVTTYISTCTNVGVQAKISQLDLMTEVIDNISKVWRVIILNSDAVPVADRLFIFLSVSFDTNRFPRRAIHDDVRWLSESVLAIVVERVETEQGSGVETVGPSSFTSFGLMVLDVPLLSNLRAGDELVGSGKT